MTDEEEIIVINKFREMYMDFPEGILEHPDLPDFILSTDSKKIGIETTQIVHSKKDKQLNAEETNFTDLVISKLVPLLPFHFSLSIDLIAEIGVGKSKREKISLEVAEFCAAEFASLSDIQHADVEHLDFDFENASEEVKNHMFRNGYKKLPKGVSSISIFRCDTHGESFNSERGAAWIPPFTKERLTEVLKDKEGKLLNYKPCDEYWLIIWQGGGITGYFKDANFEIPIQSTYDKVFAIRNTQNDIICLKP